MLFREIASFEVLHAERAWPWLAFSASADVVAWVETPSTIATRRREGDEVVSGPSFAIPDDLELAAFSVRPDAVALAGRGGVIVVGDARAALDTLVGPGHELCAIAFDRSGKRLWLSLEGATETVIALVDVATLSIVATVKSAAFPRPALHEIHLHPQDDAILVLAACGEAGTFARVVGFVGDDVNAVEGGLDAGGIAAGFVGFSSDGARVHLVEADELRTHAWPTLHELSSVPLADDFVSSFSGAVIGDEVLVDGEEAETRDDAVMLFDRAAIHGVIFAPPAPIGMWAGRLGKDAIVTVESKGDPVHARVLLRTASRAPRLGN